MRTTSYGVPLDRKADAAGEFSGYASVFGVLDSYADIVAKGAFSRTLREWRGKGRWPALLWQHDPTQPIGIWIELREDETGLLARGQLAQTQLGREARTLLDDGALSGLSIGFRVRRSQLDEVSGIRTLTDVDVVEVSLVTFPANDRARVDAIRRRTGLGREVLAALHGHRDRMQREIILTGLATMAAQLRTMTAQSRRA